MQLADLAWPVAREKALLGATLAVPLGSTEQHGPHLPLSTDTDLAVELCARLAAARTDVVVAPALPYGSSGEHAGFAGTLSIGQDALEFLVVELVRSATETFANVVLVCGHGGNAAPVTRAVNLLHAEGRDVLLHLPRWSGDAHAGHVETSVQLALRPAGVDMAAAVPGETRPLSEVLPALRSGGVAAVTPTGVLGDPTTATAAAGATLLAELADDLIERVAAWRGAPVPSSLPPDGGRGSRPDDDHRRGEVRAARGAG